MDNKDHPTIKIGQVWSSNSNGLCIWTLLDKFGEKREKKHLPTDSSSPPLYRWPFGPSGPAQARARPSPPFLGPCLARPDIPAGRAVLAHGLHRRPRHGPTGLFRAGPARGARPVCRAQAVRGPRWGGARPPDEARRTGGEESGRGRQRGDEVRRRRRRKALRRHEWSS